MIEPIEGICGEGVYISNQLFISATLQVLL